MRFRFFGLLVAGLLTACGSAKTSNFAKGTASSSSVGGAGSGGNGTASTDVSVGTGDVGGFSPSSTAGSTGSGSSDCTEASKLVYVVGKSNELYSFSPATLQFKPIGLINCASQGSSGGPFSMAVDRNGVAWVLFDDGLVYQVSTSDASCKKTTFVPSGDPSFSQFGMGFATDDAMGTAETLYVAAYGGTGLGKILFPQLKFAGVGMYDTIFESAELTGTGDGRLFAFFTGNPVIVAELDKKNGHVLSQAPQPTVDIGGGWAFAHWGGDFWLFTAPNGLTSQVDRYSPSKKTTTTVAQVNFKIVGAGVSTCAPVEQPK